MLHIIVDGQATASARSFNSHHAYRNRLSPTTCHSRAKNLIRALPHHIKEVRGTRMHAEPRRSSRYVCKSKRCGLEATIPQDSKADVVGAYLCVQPFHLWSLSNHVHGFRILHKVMLQGLGGCVSLLHLPNSKDSSTSFCCSFVIYPQWRSTTLVPESIPLQACPCRSSTIQTALLEIGCSFPLLATADC